MSASGCYSSGIAAAGSAGDGLCCCR
jgi:hypothetical protein